MTPALYTLPSRRRKATQDYKCDASETVTSLPSSLKTYWWHRWRHESSFLWRWFHQLHHSPQRIEVVTSFYKHPFELLANSVLSSAILYLLVGLGPQAAAQTVLITGLAELFYHWNVKTPHWLGFIVQRPESHCLHHQEGAHSAALAGGPVMATEEKLIEMYRSVSEYALCGKAPLLRELGIDPAKVIGAVRMRYEPLPGTTMGDLLRVLETRCK